MKNLLFIVLMACVLTSCIRIYSHKKFTYKSDGRATGIDKQLKINGYYCRNYDGGVHVIFLYADGSITSNSLQFADIKKLEKHVTSKQECMMCSFISGQCRLFGDTLFAQYMYQKEITQYGIYIDTFIVKSDTSFVKIASGGGGKGVYNFRQFATKPDSSLASIRNHNWYWTKHYKDSVYHRGAYKHRG